MTQENNSNYSFLDYVIGISWLILVIMIIKFFIDKIEIASQLELSLIDVLNGQLNSFLDRGLFFMFKFLSYSGLVGLLFLIIIVIINFDFGMNFEELSEHLRAMAERKYTGTKFLNYSLSILLAFLPISSQNQLIFLSIGFLLGSFLDLLLIIILSLALPLLLLKVAYSVVKEIIKLMSI